MKVAPSVQISQIPSHGRDPEPRPVAEPRQAEPVDTKLLSDQIQDIEFEIELMQSARASLKERVQSSEAAVSAALRAYSVCPNDLALQQVDDAKNDEKDARKRLFTSADSMDLRQKDLSELKTRHAEAMRTIVAERKNELLVERKKKTKAQTKQLEKALTELLITEHMAGFPVGMINFKSFIHTRLPTLREDVEAKARKITENLNAD